MIVPYQLLLITTLNVDWLGKSLILLLFVALHENKY